MQEAVATEQHRRVPWRSTRPYQASGTYVRMNSPEAPVFESPGHLLLLCGDATQTPKLLPEECLQTARPRTSEEYLLEEPIARSSQAIDSLESPVRFGAMDRRDAVIYFRDRGAQYLWIRNSEQLVQPKIAPTIASISDSIGDARAEPIVGRYKTVVFCQLHPWRGLEAVEFTTLQSVDLFDLQRLQDMVGNRPPAEIEAPHDRRGERLPLTA